MPEIEAQYAAKPAKKRHFILNYANPIKYTPANVNLQDKKPKKLVDHRGEGHEGPRRELAFPSVALMARSGVASWHINRTNRTNRAGVAGSERRLHCLLALNLSLKIVVLLRL